MEAELQDLQDSGRQWDVQEESRQGDSGDGVAEAGHLNQTNSSCNEPLQVKLFVQKGTVCDTLQLPVPLPE